MLLIVLLTLLIATSIVPPCLITIFKVILKFRAHKERPHLEILQHQVLKKLREEKSIVQEQELARHHMAIP